jgi:hypothetical protein
MLGEGLLGLVLVAALALSSRDAIPIVSVGATDLSAVALLPVSGSYIAGDSKSLIQNTPIVTPAAVIPSAPPVQLLIPSLDVHRAVESVGTDRSGVLNLPANYWNAGWYRRGPVPGAPGDAVIEGHAGYPGQPLIFGKLLSLRAGDKIVVVLSDGTRELFLVNSMMTVPVGTSPPGMGEPYGPSRLTLITCTGFFDKNSYSYNRRLVLDATYAGVI